MIGAVGCTVAQHERLKQDETWWRAQEQKGVQYIDGAPFLELVNCRCCSSTLARRIDCAAHEMPEVAP